MENFSTSNAIALINTALQAGAIKLTGPSGTTEHAKKQAEVDAMYLLTLLSKLQGR